jgi:hypothetical protein
MTDEPGDLSDLGIADFVDLRGDTFRLSTGETELPLVLDEVSSLVRDAGGDGPPPRPFTLIFRGPLEPLLPQRMYDLDHPDRSLAGIFLVPLGPDGEAQVYQAVFN